METRAQQGFGDDGAVINLEASHHPLYITETKPFMMGAPASSPILQESMVPASSTVYIARHSENVVKSIVLIVGLLGLFFVGFMYLTDEVDFSELSIFPTEYPEFLGDLLGHTENRIEIQTSPAPEEEIAEPAPAEVVPAVSDFLIRGGMDNPYNFLLGENVLPPHPLPMSGSWSSANEENWRHTLNHEFPYQRFKTVRSIRDARLRGSEVLLFEALNDSKFWTKWQALVGLAEFGYEIPHPVVEKVIKGQRPSLVNNYFRRFLDTPTPGALYLLRHALSIVNGNGRAIILEILAKNRGAENSLFLVAAHYDNSETVKNWLKDAAPDLRLSTSDWKRFENVALMRKNEVVEETINIKDLPVETSEDPIVDEIKVYDQN
jgi:hypothetical protein